MKFFNSPLALFAMLVAFSMSTVSQAQDSNVLLDSDNIKIEKKKLIGRATGDAKPAVKEYGDDWWSVDLKFSTTERITEEVKVKVYLAAYDSINGGEDFVVLTGEVTFINVLQGEDHRATFYLHPASAKRFGGEKEAESFGRTSGEHNVHVEIFEKGRVVADIDMEEDEPGWFRQGPPVSGVLISVEKSPWWPYESLAYSQIKEER